MSNFIYGIHSVESILNNHPEEVIKILLSHKKHNNKLKKIISISTKYQIPLEISQKKTLNKISNNASHQGVLAYTKPRKYPNQNALLSYINDKNSPFILILDGVQDPRNLGACIRSANGLGVDIIAITKNSSSPINALVDKSSAGTLNSSNIFMITNLNRLLRSLKEINIWIVGLDGKADKNIHQISFSSDMNIALVIGSEGKGLRELTKRLCDFLVSIPMANNVESLNLSVATAIALFEIRRQRLYF